MQIWAESGKSALPICNYSQILYQFLTFTQNLKRSRGTIGYHVRNLRKKLYSADPHHPFIIESVREVGYRFQTTS